MPPYPRSAERDVARDAPDRDAANAANAVARDVLAKSPLRRLVQVARRVRVVLGLVHMGPQLFPGRFVGNRFPGGLGMGGR